jgi:hypothetical protein
VKHENIALSGTQAVTISAEMRIGAIGETITVRRPAQDSRRCCAFRDFAATVLTSESSHSHRRVVRSGRGGRRLRRALEVTRR